MSISKINATTSSNSYLKALLKKENLPDGFVVFVEEQTAGRGQMGTSWQSQKLKSLTFSVFKELDGFEIENQFYLSKAVSLAVLETLNHYNISETNIKWPNDILSADKKLCGILIENTIVKRYIKSCIIGIGLNVNEAFFTDLPNATSMKLQAGVSFDRDEVLNSFLSKLDQLWRLIEAKQFSIIDGMYLESLYRLNKVSIFENNAQEKFVGKIKGVSPEGKLLIELEWNEISAFDLKEIKFLSHL